MNERVQQFINAKKLEEKQRVLEEKNRMLISLGLFEKEISPNGYSSEYTETMQVDGKVKYYYKKVPIEVSDEEFDELKKYASSSTAAKGASWIKAYKTANYIMWAVYAIAGLKIGNSLDFYNSGWPGVLGLLIGAGVGFLQVSLAVLIANACKNLASTLENTNKILRVLDKKITETDND